MNQSRLFRTMATVAITALATACGPAETTVLSEDAEVEVVFAPAASETHTASLAPAAYTVSASETVELDEIVLVAHHLGFHEMSGDGHMDEADMGMAPAAPGHGDEDSDGSTTSDDGSTDGHDGHADMIALEEAGPFVIDLGHGATTAGTFLVPAGSYGMVDISLGPLEAGSATDGHAADAEGLTLLLHGTYVSTATAVTETAPFSAWVTASSELSMTAHEPMALDGHTRAEFHLDAHSWLDGLDLAPARVSDSTGVRYEISSSSTPTLADELWHAVTESFGVGIDLDGDGHVDAGEILAESGHDDGGD